MQGAVVHWQAKRERLPGLDCVFFPNPLPGGVKVPPQVGGWVWGLGFIWPPKWVGGYGVWGFLC